MTLLDHGPEPEHARHLEHQRDLQPAPGHRRDLPARQRAVLADRPAQRDGRPRDGLHGSGSARAAVGARRTTTARSSRTLWGLPAGHDLRTDVGHGTIEMFERMAAGEIKACWIICTNPVAIGGQPQDRHRRAARPPSSSSPRTSSPTPRPTRYADIVLPGDAVGRVRRRDGQLRAQPDAARSRRSRPGEARAGLAADLPGRRRDWASVTHFDYASSARRSSTRSRRSPTRRPATTCAASSYERLRDDTGAVAGARPTTRPDRHPIRYLNDGVSQDLFVDDGRASARGWRSPPRRGGRCSSPGRTSTADELPDDDYPVRAQHRPAAAPVAHDDQDRQGRQAQQARQRAVRRDPPRRRGGLGIADGQPVELTSRRGRAVLPAVVTDRVRPGNCFAPFHWNDEHGEYLTINAVTNDAVDPDSLQPEFKVCAVSCDRSRSSTPRRSSAGRRAARSHPDQGTGTE